jgi:hypothetical protein
MKGGKGLFVARGRGKFTPPKPGGSWMTMEHFLDFRGATLTACEYLDKFRPMIASPSADYIPSRPRRKQRWALAA